MDGAERLLFKPEYRWPKDKFSAPFFTMPAWWRRFVFQVLVPRNVTIYLYYLSVMNRAGLAWPAVRQVASDLGVRDLDTVRGALRRLVDAGFLIAPTDDERRAFSLGERPIYQHPHPAYTIHKLLEGNLVDGELYPMSNRERTADDKASDSVVLAGMKTMLGESMFAAYREALSLELEDRRAVLTDTLKAMVAEKLLQLLPPAPKKTVKAKVDLKVFEGLPKSIRKALRLEGSAVKETRPKATTRRRRAK